MLSLFAALCLLVATASAVTDVTGRGDYYTLSLFNTYHATCSRAPAYVTQGLSIDFCASYTHQPTIKTKFGSFKCPWITTEKKNGGLINFWGEASRPCSSLVLQLTGGDGACHPMPAGYSLLLEDGSPATAYTLNLTKSK